MGIDRRAILRQRAFNLGKDLPAPQLQSPEGPAANPRTIPKKISITAVLRRWAVEVPVTAGQGTSERSQAFHVDRVTEQILRDHCSANALQIRSGACTFVKAGGERVSRLLCDGRVEGVARWIVLFLPERPPSGRLIGPQLDLALTGSRALRPGNH